MKALILLVLAATALAARTSTQDQILALLQTGTKAHDAIDSVFELLNDLRESNDDAQYAQDEKNKTDEEIGQATISKFTQVQTLNQKLYNQAIQQRQNFEAELRQTKVYLAWNEARREEIQRKSDSLEDNQCLSNQLFVKALKHSQEALEAIGFLKQDLQSYVASGVEDFDLLQMKTTEVKSVADKLKRYSQVFNANEINSFLQLADSTDSDEEEEEKSAPGKRRGTLPQQLLQVLEDLEAEVSESIDNLKSNEINAAWQLSAWLSSSEAEIAQLQEEFTRKELYADRTATQIQAALAQQAKSLIIVQESTDALNQAISDLENKREVYAQDKAQRDEQNAILDEVKTQFKNQVASWSGRF